MRHAGQVVSREDVIGVWQAEPGEAGGEEGEAGDRQQIRAAHQGEEEPGPAALDGDRAELGEGWRIVVLRLLVGRMPGGDQLRRFDEVRLVLLRSGLEERLVMGQRCDRDDAEEAQRGDESTETRLEARQTGRR